MVMPQSCKVPAHTDTVRQVRIFDAVIAPEVITVLLTIDDHW